MANKQGQLEAIMREATTVFRKGNLPLALRLFSQATIMDGGKNEIILNARALVYIRMNKFEEALEDAERIIELKKSWVKGYLRKGEALNGLGNYAEAFMVLMEGLDKDPRDNAIKAAMLESKKQMTGGNGDGPIASPFADFKLWDKIEKNPLTRQYLNQPDFRQIVSTIQRNPNELKNFMDDARIMTTVGMLLDVDIEAPVEAAGDQGDTLPVGLGGLSSSGIFRHLFPQLPASGLCLGDDIDEVAQVSRGPTITELSSGDEEVAVEATPRSKGKRNKKNKSARKAAAASKATHGGSDGTTPSPAKDGSAGVTPSSILDGATRAGPSHNEELPIAEKLPGRGEGPPLSTGNLKALEAKERGNAAYKQKEFDTAIEHYTTAIELDPSNLTFRTNRAAVYFEQKKYEECIKECEEAITVGRETRADFKLIAKAMCRIGNAYLKMKDLESALKYFEKSVSEHRTSDVVQKILDLKKQVKEQERISYVDIDKSLEAKKAGNSAFTEGNYPVAINHYNEAIKRNPDDAKLFSNRAACYTKLAEFSMAVKDANECIRLDPTFVKGYLRKGGCLLAMKEFNKARLAYQKAMEIDQGCQEALDGFRRCSAEENDPEAVQQRVMNDPEIRKILQDPGMQTILSQMQQDTSAVREHLKNPVIAAKIQKLIDSGLIRMQPM